MGRVMIPREMISVVAQAGAWSILAMIIHMAEAERERAAARILAGVTAWARESGSNARPVTSNATNPQKIPIPWPKRQLRGLAAGDMGFK